MERIRWTCPDCGQHYRIPQTKQPPERCPKCRDAAETPIDESADRADNPETAESGLNWRASRLWKTILWCAVASVCSLAIFGAWSLFRTRDHQSDSSIQQIKTSSDLQPKTKQSQEIDDDWFDPVHIGKSGKATMKFRPEIDFRMLAVNVTMMKQKQMRTGLKEWANVVVGLRELEHHELLPKGGRRRVILLFDGEYRESDHSRAIHIHGYAIISFANGYATLDEFKDMSILDPKHWK